MEEPLPAGGSCLLGSINLSAFVKNPYLQNAYFDYEDFKYTVAQCVIGLNEVLDEGLALHPLQEQKETVKDLRQIGLGIMGIADMLIQLGIKYGSDESLKFCDELGFVMADTALYQSALLAKEFGAFPRFTKEILKSDFLLNNSTEATYDLINTYGLRNSQILTIAPTGSLSTMLGISGGIEPIFNISYVRKTQTLNNGEETFYKVYTPIAKSFMETNNISEESELPDIFVTAMTLTPLERIKMQGVWQSHIDASISSTVNLPKEATVEDVADIYMQAWEYGLKGITVYRDGCRRGGILINEEEPIATTNYATMTNDEIDETIKQLEELKKSKAEVEDSSPKCPVCNEKINHTGGCKECPSCGWSACSI